MRVQFGVESVRIAGDDVGSRVDDSGAQLVDRDLVGEDVTARIARIDMGDAIGKRELQHRARGARITGSGAGHFPRPRQASPVRGGDSSG